MRLRALAAVAAFMILACAGAAQARLQPAPAAWTPEAVAVKTDAFITEQLAATSNRLEALSLVQMLRPDHPVAVSKLATLLGSKAPIHRFRELLDFKPDDPAANYYLALKLGEEGYVRLAQPYYRTAVAGLPTDKTVLYNAALNAFYADDNALCVELFTRALATGELSAARQEQSRLKRGECHARSGNMEAAKNDFTNSGAGGGHYSIRMLADGAYRCRGGNAESRVREAEKLFSNGKAYEAYREATRVLACEPQNVGALRQRLAIEKRDNNLARHARVHEIQLQALLDGGRAEAARAAELRPPTAAAMLAEGKAIDMTNDPTGERRVRAGYLASRVLMVDPDNADAHLLLARALLNVGLGKLSPLAYQEATRALTLNPRLAVGHFVRAMIYMRGDGYKEAMIELNAAIAIDPSDLRFIAQRGTAQMRMKNYAPAIQDLSAWIAANPGELEMRTNRALAYFGQNQFAAALADLDAAAAANPGAFAPKAYAVRVLDAMGRKSEADQRHIALLTENEKAATADSYLAERTTPDLLRTAAEGQARRRANATFQGLSADYDEATDKFTRFVRRTENPRYPDDPERELSGLQSSLKAAEDKTGRAYARASDFLDSPDFKTLSDEQQLKVARWMADLLRMQDMLAKLRASLDDVTKSRSNSSDEDEDAEWEY